MKLKINNIYQIFYNINDIYFIYFMNYIVLIKNIYKFM